MPRQRKRPKPPPLDEDLILSWADAHHARHGVWPTSKSGPIDDSPEDTWGAISAALYSGNRGLLPGSSLSLLLEERRSVFRHCERPTLSEAQILTWARQHAETHGTYPGLKSGPIDGVPHESWSAVDVALRNGARGLPGNSSLPKLLHEHFGRRNRSNSPELTIDQILSWMDEHYARTGEWPTIESGPVAADPSETWSAVDSAISHKLRGFPYVSSLFRLAVDFRGMEDPKSVSLTVPEIIGWIQAYVVRHGRYPTGSSERVEECPSKVWRNIDRALKFGYLGLSPGQSLAKLREDLIEREALPKLRPHRPSEQQPLREAQITELILSYLSQHGKYPSAHSGPIIGGPQMTWGTLNKSLRDGAYCLPGGQSLRVLIDELIAKGTLPDLQNRRSPERTAPLSVDMIANWIEEYATAHGRYPTCKSGTIDGAPEETWRAIDEALIHGRRGLPGGRNLTGLKQELVQLGRLPVLAYRPDRNSDVLK